MTATHDTNFDCHTNTERVAVKIIEKGKHGFETTLNMLRQEVSTMEKLDHPNIISLYEEIETLDKFYCVLEFVDGEILLLPNVYRYYRSLFSLLIIVE